MPELPSNTSALSAFPDEELTLPNCFKIEEIAVLCSLKYARS